MSWSRRRFLLAGGVVGGGLLIGYGLFKPRDLLGDPRILPTTVDEIALNAWLKIGADNRITIAVPRVEMGQGVHTALPMLVAEELEIGWSAVNIVQAPIDSVYGNIAMLVDGAPFDAYDNGWLAKSARWSFARLARTVGLNATGGSTSIRDAWLPMRAAGAAARQMLTRAAGVRLGVDPSDLVASDGEVVHAPTARALSYGALAADAAKLEPPTPIELKAPADFAIIGKPVRRLDVPGKVSGDAQFGIDVYDDDMLFASVLSCPVFGGTLVRVDRDALMAQPGVSAVVELHDAVAVVAQTYWHAQEALRNADIEFNHGEHAALSSAGIADRYATAMAEADFFRYENFGDVDAALDSAEHVSAEYRAPFLAHACMEPMNCTVRVDGDRADVWFGNQAPDLLRWIAAKALDLPADKVDVHTMLLGGGFGRRGEPDIVRQAARIARQVPGRAVKLLWSREQDLRHDVYRPAALSRFRARLDDSGRIIAWHNRVACPSVLRAVMTRAFPGVPAGGPDRTSVDGAAFLPYTAEHRRVEHTAVPVGVPVGFWRSVGHSFNAFFTECFVDELALAAGLDPIAFRLNNLDQRPRAARVLRLLADESNWAEPVTAGRARGVALHESFHSIVGQVAEVSIEDAHIHVHRVVCVIDCGHVINPDIVIAQMESGVIFGLTAALHGEVVIDNGRVQQSNFPDYRMVTMKDAPAIETHVIESGAEPGGVGEPGTPPIAPAVANAVAAATGVRLRALPLKLPPT